jgi:uncharacterized protein (TIGR03435 family)
MICSRVRLARSLAEGSSVATLGLGVRTGFMAVAICLSPVSGALAQDSTAPAFDVASLKPSGSTNPVRDRLFEMEAVDNRSGRLPGRGQKIEIHGMNVAELVAAAYRVPLEGIVGPSWIFDVRFDIDALIPSGQARDKAPEMLLTLLQERLALKAHREVRKTSGYILSVGKSGPKLTETGPFKPSGDVGDFANRSKPAPGYSEQLGHCDMAQLADVLAQHLKAPVEDRTGLKGFYAIQFHIPSSDMRDEALRPAAFADALGAYGLHLAAGKIDAPLLVIENLSKTPTPN